MCVCVCVYVVCVSSMKFCKGKQWPNSNLETYYPRALYSVCDCCSLLFLVLGAFCQIFAYFNLTQHHFWL